MTKPIDTSAAIDTGRVCEEIRFKGAEQNGR